METRLSIGDFARASHLSVKTLRYYHQAGLLEPSDIDPNSGYRRYDLAQIPTAQVIRRFRALDMPVDEIRSILRAPDPATRSELISQHLRRLEAELGRTQRAVASLRDLLEHPTVDFPVEHRLVARMRVAAITDEVGIADVGAWHHGAMGELYATLAAQGIEPTGAAGGIYADALFTREFGEATVFVPAPASLRPVGRMKHVELPDVELAIVTHSGPDNGIDRAYGALADYVTRHTLAVDGPIREFYPVNQHHTEDVTAWKTEIGWPIFETSPVVKRLRAP